MFDKKLLKNIDWLFVGFLLLLLGMSVVVLMSASRNVVSGQPYYIVKKQLIWMAGGFFIILLVGWYNYQNLNRFSKYLYALTLLMLIGVLFMPAQKGAHRWYDLGFFDFQPSELAKILVIVVFAAFLANRQDRITEWSTFWLSFVIVGAPMLLVFAQPDLGTSLVFCAFMLAMMVVGGIPARRLLVLVLLVLLVAMLLFGTLYFYTDGYQHLPEDLPGWMPLHGYQLTRLIIFINPDMDPLGAGYHIIQSHVAIGSGGLWGKGFAQGSQVQGNFLPEHHTDFIFSVVGEEFGFIGALVLLGVYLMLILRLISIALASKDMFGTLIVTGIVAVLSFQVFVNIGMSIGLMPITGIPLPFMSYGGTSMMVFMLSMGLAMSVNLRRRDLLF